MKAAHIENSRNAVDHVQLSGGSQLFARSQKRSEFPQIDVDAEKLTPLASNPLIYGSRSEWRANFAVRYGRVEGGNSDPSVGTPAAPSREQTTLREVAYVELVRIFRPTA